MFIFLKKFYNFINVDANSELYITNFIYITIEKIILKYSKTY